MSLTRRFKEALFAVAILAVMFTAAVAMGAAEPALQITSPAAGTTFNTGQTINVTVNVTALGSFKRFALIGERRLGAAAPQLASKTPLTFSLPIPANLQPGPYSLTAIGYGPNQTIIAESVVVVQIENSSALLDLITSSSALTFEAIGERLPLRIGGATPDGTPVDLTHSSHVSFASSDLTIGTVDNTGVVTAVGPGNATINVKLDSGGTAALPIHVLPPALLPSMRSIAFGNQTMGTTGKTTSFSVTNMLSYPLKILAVHSSPDFPESDNCVSTSPIPAGNSCTINVAFTPLAQGARTGFISITNSAVIAATRVALSGAGTPSPGVIARVKPDEIDFGKIKPGDTGKQKLTIRNNGTATMHGYVAPLGGSFAVIDGGGLFSVAKGHKHEVELTFSPTERPATGKVMEVSTTLNINTDDPSHASFAIRLTGEVK